VVEETGILMREAVMIPLPFGNPNEASFANVFL
jgi:hypothetical protein